jgi:hypothetical protein
MLTRLNFACGAHTIRHKASRAALSVGWLAFAALSGYFWSGASAFSFKGATLAAGTCLLSLFAAYEAWITKSQSTFTTLLVILGILLFLILGVIALFWVLITQPLFQRP